jgi:hypothetical protein
MSKEKNEKIQDENPFSTHVPSSDLSLSWAFMVCGRNPMHAD